MDSLSLDVLKSILLSFPQSDWVQLRRVCHQWNNIFVTEAKPYRPIFRIFNDSLYMTMSYHIKQLRTASNSTKDRALRIAALKGNLSLMKLAIESGADDLDGALHQCFPYGQLGAIEFILFDLGFEPTPKMINSYLRSCCISGSVEIVKLFLSFEIEIEGYVETTIFMSRLAGRSGSVKLIKFLLKSEILDIAECIGGLCLRNHYKVAKWLIKKFEKQPHLEHRIYNPGLKGACINGNRKLIDLLLSCGANPSSGLIGASIVGNLDLINLMVDRGASNFNDGLGSATLECNINAMKYFIERGADNLRKAFGLICHASKHNCYIEEKKVQALKLLIDKGVTSCPRCPMSIGSHLLDMRSYQCYMN